MIFMGKESKFVDDLVEAGALIGGMWLTLEIIKAFSKKVYKCPICQTEVIYGTQRCPTCNNQLSWC